MYPIVGRLPNILVYSYTVVWGVAILFTAGLTFWQSRERSQDARWFDGFVCGIGGALLGGRALFIWFNQAYFAENPATIWEPFRGGFIYHGALAGGLLFLASWCWFSKRPFQPYAILFTPALLGAHPAGWLACLLEGCAYGREAFISWYTADLPDSYGVYAVRYPTQLVGLLLSLLAAVVILKWIPATGRRFWLAIAMLNLIYGLLTFWRGDTMPILGGWRIDTIVAAAVTLGALSAAFFTPNRALSG